MEQGQVVAIRDCGLWQYGAYVGRQGKKFVFKVGRSRVAVDHWNVEFPRYNDDE